MPPSTTVHDLGQLVLSFHPVIAIDTTEEERVEVLLRAVGRELSMPLFAWSLTRGLVQEPTAYPNRNTSDPRGVLSHIRGLAVEGIFLLRDFARHLEDPAVCREFRDVANAFTRTCSTLVITGAGHRFPPEAEPHVLHYPLSLPGPEELREVVTTAVRSLRRRVDARLELGPGEMGRILDALAGMTCNQARQAVAAAVLRDGRLSGDDVPYLIDAKARRLGQDGLLEYFPAEDNTFELGGFPRLKEWLDQAHAGFSDEARALGLEPPKGLLLVGVQGCGKSLAARFVSRQWQLPLLKLDAGRLYDKYVGQSERNLRQALALAESMAPAVLFVDEIEKGFTGFAGGEQDGGVSQRLFATLLGWLQEKEKAVFVVATANDVFRLPPELMRKGRFDEIFFVDLPDAEERAAILSIHLGRHRQEPGAFDLLRLAAATEGFSGAEIEQAVVSGLYRSLHEHRALDDALLLEQIRATLPLSVSRREDVERLRALAGERFVPVR